MTTRGLLDTSVFIATASGRRLDEANVPDEVHISVIAIGELQAGVLAARDVETRARRLATLESVALLESLTVDGAAAMRGATLRARLVEVGRRVNVNDLWIASVALANELPVVTQDADYDALEGIGGPAIVRV